MNEYILPFLSLFLQMAPYLLLGFMIAGMLHAFVPTNVYRRWLGGNDFKSVLCSVLIGIPLPLCSCGVIPTAVSMRKEGASKGAATAFLISTPQTGIDSIAATYSVLGLPFAILRPVVALVTGLFSGVAVNVATRREPLEQGECTTAEEKSGKSLLSKCKSALEYGFSEMIQDIGVWLIVGLILAGLINIFVPDNFFSALSGRPVLNMFVVLLIAAPMYVCATGSIPIAAALMMKGLSPGAALVFLMAGPATNIASMMVLGKTMGRKTLFIYLASIVGGAVAFGLMTDYLLPAEWFTGAIGKTCSSCGCGHAAEIPWWQTASAVLLAILLFRAMILRFTKKKTELNTDMMEFKVTGMMCNHCKMHVQNGIAAVKGVESVEVDLAGGKATVKGTASSEDVVAAVKALGYECELIKG